MKWRNWQAHLKLAGVAALGAFVTAAFPLIGPLLAGMPLPDWRVRLAAAITGGLGAGWSYLQQNPYVSPTKP
jgi:hypothetical protein